MARPHPSSKKDPQRKAEPKKSRAAKSKKAHPLNKSRTDLIVAANKDKARLRKEKATAAVRNYSSTESVDEEVTGEQEEDTDDEQRELTTKDSGLPKLVSGGLSPVSHMGMDGPSMMEKSVRSIEDTKTGKKHSTMEYYELKKVKLGSEISKAITTTIWANLKFINKDEASDRDDGFAQDIMNEMNIDRAVRPDFWYFFNEDARKRLCKKRANVVTAVRLAANQGKH